MFNLWYNIFIFIRTARMHNDKNNVNNNELIKTNIGQLMENITIIALNSNEMIKNDCE